MADYLPIIVVFVIGFVAYLGKIGVTGALARRRQRQVKIKSVEIKFLTPYLEDRRKEFSIKDNITKELEHTKKKPVEPTIARCMCGNILTDDWSKCVLCRSKEAIRKEFEHTKKKPVEPTIARCMCGNILADDTLEQRRSVPGSWEKCVSCRQKHMEIRLMHMAKGKATRREKSFEERWHPLLEEEIPYIPVRPEPVETKSALWVPPMVPFPDEAKPPEEENIFQATKEDEEWYKNLAGNVQYLRSLRSMPKTSIFYKPESVTRTLRILPPFDEKILLYSGAWDSSGSKSRGLFATARQHYIDPSKGKVYQCGKTRDLYGNWVGECPICEAHEKFPDDQKSKPIEKFYYNVALVGGSQIAPVPKVWSVSRKVHEQIQLKIATSSSNISNLMTGCNIKVTRVNGFLETHLEFEEPSRISRDNIETTLANLWDLDQYVESCAKSTEELEVAALRPLSGLRRCRHCKKIYKVHHNKECHFCSTECMVLVENDTPSDKEEEELRAGYWVHWITQSGTISVRPSVIYDTEMKKVGYKAGIRKTEQWVMLKYKQVGGWKSFWILATKCKLLSKRRPDYKDGTQDLRSKHVEKMYADFRSGNAIV